MLEENEIALKAGTKLQEEYLLESVLGVGGFGITYLATDINLEKKVVIKEFLPNEIAIRKEHTTVMPKSLGDTDSFEWGIDRFLQEAKTLAKFNHHNIVKVTRFFKENGTAYFVMDYEKGQDLDEYLASLERYLTQDEILQIIIPILDGLNEVHAKDFLHRDIKPGNIFIRENGSPMLIDFGASRFAISSKSRSITQILTPGYAPVEQYSTDISKQGAYTDIYAIGAVLYKLITGNIPAEAQDRSNAIIDGDEDPYIPSKKASNIKVDTSLTDAIDWALNIRAKDRPQSVVEFRDTLLGNIKHTQVKEKEDINTNTTAKPTLKENKPNNKSKIIAGLIAVVLVVVGMFFVLKPADGFVSIDTNPKGANVIIDGKALQSQTPINNHKLSSGEHTVKLQKTGYIEVVDKLNIKKDGFTESKFDLISKTKEVVVSSSPKGALVYINGAKKSKTPYKFKIDYDKNKEYKIEIKKDNFETLTKQFSCMDLYKNPSKKFTLVRNKGVLKITSNVKKAQVWINGKKVGKTPYSYNDFQKDKEYLIELKDKRYISTKKSINYTKIKDINYIDINLKKTKQTIAKEKKRFFNSINMIKIKAGSYKMGSSNGDSDEKPVHYVKIKKDFYIGKYEVTFKEYDKFCKDTLRKIPDDSGWGRGDRPVINVSYYDAKAYAKWLSKKTGKRFRLPTEAEWEYVARAGSNTKYSFGDSSSSLGSYAWYGDNSNSKTHKVGQKKPNKWGLYDMHGNVWEWCEDWYIDNYNKTPRDGRANTKGKQEEKVLRGGSWYSNANYLRSANRNGYYPAYTGNDDGFRLVGEP